MDVQPRGHDKVQQLLAKGVRIPNPVTLDVDDDVDVALISGDHVTLHPGTRLRGARTVISAGCTIGSEGPVTIEDCQLGPRVALKGGYASKAVFLEGSSLGLGAHVREGSILEEEANGAHTVGLKQTILFPFATLGSLINFCDCLLAGGTSRTDHSEVGSSYIHFNFTPDGDKTTASLFGDVPRGVMLDQPPIFLGGQGGAVGPVHTGFGAVVGAGSILRSDVEDDDQLVLDVVTKPVRRPLVRAGYRGLRRILERNVDYVASLLALDAWYRHARRPFFDKQPLGPLVYRGALGAIESGRGERLKRLTAMIGRVQGDDPARHQLIERSDQLTGLFQPSTSEPPRILTEAMEAAAEERSYLDAIRSLGPDAKAAGTDWLSGIVGHVRTRARETVPAMELYAG